MFGHRAGGQKRRWFNQQIDPSISQRLKVVAAKREALIVCKRESGAHRWTSSGVRQFKRDGARHAGAIEVKSECEGTAFDSVEIPVEMSNLSIPRDSYGLEGTDARVLECTFRSAPHSSLLVWFDESRFSTDCL